VRRLSRPSRFDLCAKALVACLALLGAVVPVVLNSTHAMADAATETKATALEKKAMEEDYLTTDFAKAQQKLNDAIKMCGTDKCSAKLRAALQRDLGTVLIGGLNKKPEGTQAFVEALKLDPTVTLNPDYKTKDMDAAFAEAKTKAAGAATAPTGTGSSTGSSTGTGGGNNPPSNDLTLQEIDEQRVDTPVPIYVEYTGSETVKKIVARYKGWGGTDFKALDLKKMGSGYGALVPCAEVTEGDFKFYVQAFNDEGDMVASTGSKNNPHVIKIRKELEGEPPHLPNQPAPKQCKKTSDCPDGPAGAACRGETKKAEGDECKENDECESGTCTDEKCAAGGPKLKGGGEECEADSECESSVCKDLKCTEPASSSGKYKKVWIGIGIGFDLTVLPSATDVCMVNKDAQPSTSPTGPASDQGYRCYDSAAGRDYPRTDNADEYGQQIVGKAGAVNGGIAPGNLRLHVSFDYAVTQSILIGARVGVALFGYPGTYATSLPTVPIIAEARFTYVLGGVMKTVAPFFGVAAGFSPYTASVSVPVENSAGKRSVDAHALGGPIYIAPAGGIRLRAGPAAISIGLRPVLAFGNLFTFSIEPELGVAFGF
jgi:hypothetical protein